VAQSTTTAPTNGQIPIGNGTDYTAATITAGTGISVTNGAGSISIAATGGGTVTSVATSGGLTGGTITTTGTLSINTNNSVGVGSYALFWNATTAVANGATFSGANYYYAGGSTTDVWTNFSTTVSGTWRNVSGVTISSTQYGIAIRTA
jgi:trimeric autotransporter adhesin